MSDKLIAAQKFFEGHKFKWVVISSDKTNILYDPTTRLPWCTESRQAAEIMAKEVREDFGQDAWPCELKQAVILLGEHRYGIKIKKGETNEQQYNNVLKAIMEANAQAHRRN